MADITRPSDEAVRDSRLLEVPVPEGTSRIAEHGPDALRAAFEEGRVAGGGDLERAERYAAAEELEDQAARLLRRANELRAMHRQEGTPQ